MGACCSNRDRNDRVYGIETRNCKFFYYNFPLLIKDIDQRLIEGRVTLNQARIDKGGNSTSRSQSLNSNGFLTQLDINHFRWLKSQLVIEIESNKINLSNEMIQKYKRRLAVEICDAEGFDKIPLSQGTKLSQCKCLVRIQFGGLQKKTKKNVNCNNPKFYEIFRYNLEKPNINEEQLLIQVIFVEQKDVWKLVAQTNIGLKDFEDQLVHPVSVSMNILKEPVKVLSNAFKHKGELSEFSFSMENEVQNTPEYESGILKHSRKNSTSSAIVPPSSSNLDDGKLSPRSRAAEREKFNLLSPQNMSIDQHQPPWMTNNTKNEQIFANYYENPGDILSHESSQIFENLNFLRNSDSADLYSGEKMRLNLKIQMLTNGESYLMKYIEIYDQKLQEVNDFLDEYYEIVGPSTQRSNSRSVNF
eukprot:403357064